MLDGALAVALPTKFGQWLEVEKNKDNCIEWTSIDCNNEIWYHNKFKRLNDTIKSEKHQDDAVSKRLMQILEALNKLSPFFLNEHKHSKITTKLTFPQNWGLGSSSTLINNIAQWSGVDPYKLLNLTFGGSGYDIACASNNNAISYQINVNRTVVKPIVLSPKFIENLFFIHLNQKQNSRVAIQQYNLKKDNISEEIGAISLISSKLISCNSLNEFETLLSSHEKIISKIIDQETIKQKLFRDYKGMVKSLGAWGGDFVLATGSTNDMTYFREKGFNTILPYKEMIL